MKTISLSPNFLFLLLVCGLCACASTPEYKRVREPDIATSIVVVDEAGRPVFAAEVWRVATPAPTRSRSFSSDWYQSVSSDYLLRVMKRYGGVAEFASESRPGFLNPLPSTILSPAFNSLEPTDEAGRSEEVIKFETGRPTPVSLTYAAMSHGYLPAAVKAEIQPKERKLQLRIVLKRDDNVVLPAAPYWTTYQQMRWKFGSWQWDKAEQARESLIAAAQAAEKAGDRKIAARIYSWVPFLPTSMSIAKTSGSLVISGYEREDERSARNIALLKQAAVLDPDSRYIRMKLLFLQPPASRAERIAALEALEAGGIDDLWPQVYESLEEAYYAAGLKEQAYQQFLRFKALEPDDPRNQKDSYKQRLARHVSISEFERDFVVAGDYSKNDAYLNTPIYYAIHAGRVDILDYLLNKGVPLPGYAMFQSVASRRPEMVRRVLEESDRQGLRHGDLRREIRFVDDVSSSFEDIESLAEIRRMLTLHPSHAH